jgi:AraC family transcriptional regulator
MSFTRRIEPLATDWQRCSWINGAFDTARRPYTEVVEGTIHTPHHLVMLTVSGGSAHQEVVASCGHRYVGNDRKGAVSFVPAHCHRRLSLRGVQSAWASVALHPTLFEDETFGANGSVFDSATFTNAEDKFIEGMLTEMWRLFRRDGSLDPLYCDTMSVSLARYLLSRYAQPGRLGRARRVWKLPPWRLRRVEQHVRAHIGQEIRIRDLAEAVGVSPGYLHRAFRVTTGQTPLAYINERRVRRAMQILESEPASLAEIALRVGFASPSHLTRTFRVIAGLNPSQYRAAKGIPVHRRTG